MTAEPGRAIVAAAAVTLYTVGHGQGDPERPHLRVGRRRHERQPAPGALRQRLRDVPAPGARSPTGTARSPWSASTASPATCSCATPRCPTTSRSGDLLATPVTGAYGHSMGSNYNKVPRPAVVFVRDGQARVVVRRETEDDLLRFDL